MEEGDESRISPEELARAIAGLWEWAEEHAEHAPPPEPVIRRRLRTHFGADPAELPVVSTPLQGYDRVNFQVAIEAFLGADGRSGELIGLPEMHGYRAGLAELAKPGSRYEEVPDPGPPEYETVHVGERTITCVAAGLWLIHDQENSLALMLVRAEHGPHSAELGLEAMAKEQGDAEELLATLAELMDEHNVYRGRILELSQSHFGGVGVSVRRLPPVDRQRIILAEGVLERIERHTERFTAHAEQLRRSGRHLRRGLLLHGPPGTGKTLTAMYLATHLPGRTTFLLTGQGAGAIEESCEMARKLLPAMIVLEDVDLVALDRTFHATTNALLFELLNQMDGLNEDADIVFVLTTNRPDVVEPALAARPGRIDLAVELPLPDADARARLLDLYGEGLDLALEDRAKIIEATEGVSPAFIRELVRRAALVAAEEGEETRVRDAHVAAALDELRQAGDELTGALLGRAGSELPEASSEPEGPPHVAAYWTEIR